MATLVLSFLLLIFLVVLFAFVDVWHLFRFICYALKIKALHFMKKNFKVGPKHSVENLVKPLVLHGVVLPSDIDYLMHMNNSKYLREMDFGRMRTYYESGMREMTRPLGAVPVVSAISIRYRKSLQLWQRFSLSTKTVHWDDNATYLEQRFVGSDGFVYAIAMVKMVLRSMHNKERYSPADVFKKMAEKEGVEIKCPPLSPEFESWIESLDKSSESMKNGHLPISQKKSS